MNGLSQKIRNIWGHGDDEDDFRDDETDEVESAPAPRTTSYSAPSSSTPSYGGGSGGAYNPRKPRLVAPSPLRAGREKNIYTLKPKSQEDAAIAADYLKTGTAVIINLEDVERSHAIRIIDFMSGVCYGLEHQGHAMKLGDTIFLYTPGDFEISSDETDYGENEAPFFNDVNARKAAQQQAQATPQAAQQSQPIATQQQAAPPVSQQPSAAQNPASTHTAQPNPYAPAPRRPSLIPDAPSQHASPSPYAVERRPWER